MESLGIVIATPEGPSVTNFSFVMNSATRSGEFVSVHTKEGNLLAVVEDIFKSNKYFESAGAVQEYSRGSNIQASFPVKEWEYTVADCRTLGFYSSGKKHHQRPNYPPPPGAEVKRVEPTLLNRFLGFDQKNGLHLGNVYNQNLDSKINLGNLVKKHMAILAISGAGKSYTTSVLIEEILNRKKEQGRIALVVLDNHGEYRYLGKSEFSKKVEVVDSRDVKINIQNYKGWAVRRLFPSMSAIQQRTLDGVIASLKESGVKYDLDKLIESVRSDDSIKTNVKDPLVGWLSQMKNMGLFSTADYPNIKSKIKPGNAFIINLRGEINNKKKQIIVDHISNRLFFLRRKGLVPPYLQIIEEAHNFCPGEQKAEEAVARTIIRTLAREGRKFNANICLISQRPVQLDTTTLSQCNTQIIMRITNPFDLDQIKKSSEAISGPTLKMISGLRVGEAYIIGAAVNHPVLVNIRERKASPGKELSLEEEALEYEEQQGKKMAKGEEFL